MKKDWIDRDWIISHLPKDIPTKVLESSIQFGGYYVYDNLTVWLPGEHGEPDKIIYQATDEADLRFWTFGEVCYMIALLMELRNREQDERLWRYVRDHVKDNHWIYRENKDYRYNAIHDHRRFLFEMELQLMKPVVPHEIWEKTAKEREELMNKWFKRPHWSLNRNKVCFEEISDSKEFDGLYKQIEEPRPGSIL